MKHLLPEQPYDAILLSESALYRLSRKHFINQGGTFAPQLNSSARALGSASLLSQEIQFSPIATELEWSRTDRLQKKDFAHFEQVRSWITGIYHEQNHRILWKFLRGKKLFCPSEREAAYRFLNLTESLIVILDMALGDELSARRANSLYLERGIYNGGSPYFRKVKKRSADLYRNSLLVCLTATYLRLEGMHPDDIPGFAQEIYSQLPWKIVERSVARALKIEPLFVELTNPIWQKKHVAEVMRLFRAPKNGKSLVLPRRKPLENSEIARIGSDWLQTFGL